VKRFKNIFIKPLNQLQRLRTTADVTLRRQQSHGELPSAPGFERYTFQAAASSTPGLSVHVPNKQTSSYSRVLEVISV
jgi:hypothetical protein